MAAGVLDLNEPAVGEVPRAARNLGAAEADILDLNAPAAGGILDLNEPVEPPSFLRRAAAFGARLVPPLAGAAAGAAIGTALGPPGMAAGFIGGMLGGGVGAAGGEAAGRAIEGQEQRFAPIATAGVLGAIPGIPVKNIPLRALEGAAQGLFATTAMNLAEGHGLPSPGEAAVGAGAGAGLGLLLRRAFDGKGYWLKPTAKPPVAAEDAAVTLKAAEDAWYQARKVREFSEAERLQAAERSAIETELAMERALPEPGRMEPPEYAPRVLPPVEAGIPAVPGLEHFGQPPVGPVEAGGFPGLGPGERAVPPAMPPPLIRGGPAQPPFPPPPQGGAPVERRGPDRLSDAEFAVLRRERLDAAQKAGLFDNPEGLTDAEVRAIINKGGPPRGGLEGDLTRPWVGVKSAIGPQGGPLQVPPSYTNPNVYDLTAEAALLRDLPLKRALPAALSGNHATAMDALEAGVRAGFTPPEDVASIRAVTGLPPPRLHAEELPEPLAIRSGAPSTARTIVQEQLASGTSPEALLARVRAGDFPGVTEADVQAVLAPVPTAAVLSTTPAAFLGDIRLASSRAFDGTLRLEIDGLPEQAQVESLVHAMFPGQRLEAEPLRTLRPGRTVFKATFFDAKGRIDFKAADAAAAQLARGGQPALPTPELPTTQAMRSKIRNCQ